MSDDKKKDNPRKPDKPWGYMFEGEFIEVPWLPLVHAGMKPPVTVNIRGKPREIIEMP